MKRSISETASIIVGSLGMEGGLIICKLGHSVGKVVIIEAIAPSGKFDPNLRSKEVIWGGRSKGMKETESLATPFNLRDFRFGSKGSLNAQHCSTERNTEGSRYKSPSSSLRIL